MKTICRIMLITSCSLLAIACRYHEDFQLSQSTFIEDVTAPGLPIYSEWGYNTFGAYIDRVEFTSNTRYLPAKVIVNADTLNLLLAGTYQGVPTTMKFVFKGFSPKEYTDLNSLSGITVDFKGAQFVELLLIQYGREKKLDIIQGAMEFKRVQQLYVDKEFTKAIVSGRFACKAFNDEVPIAIANGRFDLGIGYDNFYNY